jgi:hypothetical protein
MYTRGRKKRGYKDNWDTEEVKESLPKARKTDDQLPKQILDKRIKNKKFIRDELAKIENRLGMEKLDAGQIYVMYLRTYNTDFQRRRKWLFNKRFSNSENKKSIEELKTETNIQAEKEIYGCIPEILNKRAIYKDYVGSFVYGMVWTSDFNDLGNFYHATSVVQFTDNKNKPFYLEISHQNNGTSLVKKSRKFPYIKLRPSTGKLNRYVYSDDETDDRDINITGGIVCQGFAVNDVDPVKVVGAVLKWWYIYDKTSSGSKQFPSSCTGLTEFIIEQFMDDESRQDCLNIYGTQADKSLMRSSGYPLKNFEDSFSIQGDSDSSDSDSSDSETEIFKFQTKKKSKNSIKKPINKSRKPTRSRHLIKKSGRKSQTRKSRKSGRKSQTRKSRSRKPIKNKKSR